VSWRVKQPIGWVFAAQSVASTLFRPRFTELP
jgi:hypothetical protein